MERIEYNWLTGHLAQENGNLLAEFSELYSNHYGNWSQSVAGRNGKGPEAGGKIKLSPVRIRQWLKDPDSLVYYAKCNGNCIGYAIAIRKQVKDYGVVSWVTQLVVRKDFRNQGIAKRPLFSFWGLSDDFAWGILSANPYAVRALEKATRRRSVPMRIRRHTGKLMEIVYRREQFKRGTEIPVELVVRDRRFSMDEIKAMWGKAGLKVLLSRYVDASDWDTPLEATDERAKEILLKCEKI